MVPTLADGDDIMVDRSVQGTKVQDGIYVLRQGDTLSVKRVAVHPGSSTLTISSDNTAYPTWRDCLVDSVEIIGRVVWAGRKIS
jgi:phage repressor protein C with HTH and peptisase S24 domain